MASAPHFSMATPEPDKEAGTPKLVQETEGDTTGPEEEIGIPGPKQEMYEAALALKKVDFFTIDWPEGRVPTHLNKEYASFLLCDVAHHLEAKPHNKISKYFQFDKIYKQKCERQIPEEEWALYLEKIGKRMNQLKEQGYRNQFALSKGVLAISTSNSNLQASAQAAKDIVEDTLDAFGDVENCAILVKGLKNHLQTHLNVIEELREDWWGPQDDDPLRQVSLASWIHSIACYTQVLDLLACSTAHLVVAYDEEALIFQGRSVNMDEFHNQFGFDHNSFAPPIDFLNYWLYVVFYRCSYIETFYQ
ncbi:uncharacterized protein STEHIDRAFT_107661 [Stereum hirsutum FP-91666 SS1]|uniref:uncharacterized protein n=1 Tax=Stereum hirsutum (strain FP-91666) TaxID=721885 RepID=UPI000441058A|nr:uncharacterized protein STEHIDRAFT_107661 [Stereum hirsutum FP-91666 SS1]EIM90977.1 hypothetical protein STEHIDRAFT_107661 [Stereum hirsutum FP-91666 SS1]